MAVLFDKEFANVNFCFFCNKKINHSEGYIYWCSSVDQIALHKDCAAEFMAHLGSDLVKLKHESNKKHKIEIF